MAPVEVLASVELRHPFLGQHTLSALRLGEQAAPPSVRVPEGRRWHPRTFLHGPQLLGDSPWMGTLVESQVRSGSGLGPEVD